MGRIERLEGRMTTDFLADYIQVKDRVQLSLIHISEPTRPY